MAVCLGVTLCSQYPCLIINTTTSTTTTKMVVCSGVMLCFQYPGMIINTTTTTTTRMVVCSGIICSGLSTSSFSYVQGTQLYRYLGFLGHFLSLS